MFEIKAMFFVTILVLVIVSVVNANVNFTTKEVSESNKASTGKSRMAWMKTLLDHHDWLNIIENSTVTIPPQCEDDLRKYVTALHNGQLWASKMYDASGQYSSSVLFGNEYWLGSINACRDLQLARYYEQTPPFPTTFYVAKINVTLDEHHLPRSKTILVGECVPAACSANAMTSLLAAVESTAATRAATTGIGATFHTIHVRSVPGSYKILADTKLHILGSATIAVALLILIASMYEGYLEWRYRQSRSKRDLELAGQNNHKAPANDNAQQTSGNQENNTDKDIRRETCGFWTEVLLSFSILSNGRIILSTEQPNDGALTCLHGMRFLSVSWVIMVHTCLTVFYVADNKTLRIIAERNFIYQSIGNASYCVDTFFFISGLLVTMLFLRTEDKKANREIEKLQDKQDINKNINGYTNSALSVSVISQQSFNEDVPEKSKDKIYTAAELLKITKSFFVLFLYRVVRLTPAYAFVIGLNEIVLRYTHNNSVFEPAIFDHITCDLFWWRNLLYINNLYPQREMCMVWSWYMANDTQFYVVGIILLLISMKYPKFSMLSLSALMVSSWATTIYISVWNQYKVRIQEPFEMFDPLYDKPWSRIGPYLIGMIVGWYLHKTKCQVKIPYWLVAVGWPCALAIIASLIFGMIDGYLEVWPTAFYVSIGHTAWGVALAWMTISCCCGYGGLVNSALSYRGLLPLSRLTYCAYLVHPTIMMYSTFLMDGPFHLENTVVLALYAGYSVMSFFASFVISLAFEAPAVRLLKIVNGVDGKKNQ